jgi:putative tryptophan/tyrosine transport system substrate-binding protein
MLPCWRGNADAICAIDTARVHHAARRRGGVAARGACTTDLKSPAHRFSGGKHALGVEARLQRFRAGLRDLGYVEGQNIFIDFRWAEGNYSRLVEFAAELLHLKADVLVTDGTPGTLAAKEATTTAPIVMIVSGDAVATGIVASLARPGGNVTGSTFFNPELSAKRLEVVKEARPSARRVAILLNPGNPINAPVMGATEIAAKSLGLEVLSFETRRSDELRSTFSRMTEAGVDAVGVTDDTHFVGNARMIADLAISNRLPSIGFTEFAKAGGLIGYGVNLGDLWYRGAFFVDRILKGIRPADLPVEQPTKFEMAINLNTAKALSLEVPSTLLTRADEVIE